MNAILTYINENWQRLNLDDLGKPTGLSSVVATPRFKASSHLIFFVLSEQASQPMLVVKTPRVPGDNQRLEREVRNLRWIHSRWQARPDSIPRVVAFEDYFENRILIETALTFETMRPAIVRRQPEACISAVMEWLLDLQMATRTNRDSNFKTLQNLIEKPMAALESALGQAGPEGRLLRETRRAAEVLNQYEWPFVCEHGDLSSPNILFGAGNQVGVVDWELAEPQGLPAVDLFFFLTFIAFAKRNARRNKEYLTAFHDAFWGEEPWTVPSVIKYCETLEISKDLLRPLFLLCWSRYVAGLVQRLLPHESTAGLSRQTIDWLRKNRYYVLWCHTVEHFSDLKF